MILYAFSINNEFFLTLFIYMMTWVWPLYSIELYWESIVVEQIDQWDEWKRPKCRSFNGSY